MSFGFVSVGFLLLASLACVLWLWGFGLWVLGCGFKLLALSLWVLALGLWLLGCGYRLVSCGLWLLACGVLGFGCFKSQENPSQTGFDRICVPRCIFFGCILCFCWLFVFYVFFLGCILFFWLHSLFFGYIYFFLIVFFVFFLFFFGCIL